MECLVYLAGLVGSMFILDLLVKRRDRKERESIPTYRGTIRQIAPAPPHVFLTIGPIEEWRNPKLDADFTPLVTGTDLRQRPIDGSQKTPVILNFHAECLTVAYAEIRYEKDKERHRNVTMVVSGPAPGVMGILESQRYDVMFQCQGKVFHRDAAFNFALGARWLSDVPYGLICPFCSKSTGKDFLYVPNSQT